MTFPRFTTPCRRLLLLATLFACGLLGTVSAQTLTTVLGTVDGGEQGYVDCNIWYEWVWIDEDTGYWEEMQDCYWVHEYYWWVDAVQAQGTASGATVYTTAVFSDGSEQQFTSAGNGGPVTQLIYYTEFDPYPTQAFAIQTNPNDPAQDYDWNWEQVPGYPVGRVWDGITIASDFPGWNWQNWPNNWFMTSEGDDDPDVAALFAPGARGQWETAERLRKIQKLQKLRRVASISRASVPTLVANLLIGVWLQAEIERLQQQGAWSYIVYEMLSTSGAVYSGQAQGPGSPDQIRARRDSEHWYKRNVLGYNSAVIRAAMTSQGYPSLFALAAMYGREQQHIDYHGGSRSDRNSGRPNLRGHDRNRAPDNLIRSPNCGYESDIGFMMYQNSNLAWPTEQFLSPYTGNPALNRWVPIPATPPQIIWIESHPPYFYPN